MYDPERINAQSEQLIKEFHEHLRECQAAGMTDEALIFHGWAIQKIAGLQLLVLDLVKRIDSLESSDNNGN